jgi:hypothetical protein
MAAWQLGDNSMSAAPENEILEAIQRAGIRPRAFAQISKLKAPGNGRRVFRIDHDGGTVKARRVEDEPTARRLEMLGKMLPDALAAVRLNHY